MDKNKCPKIGSKRMFVKTLPKPIE